MTTGERELRLRTLKLRLLLEDRDITRRLEPYTLGLSFVDDTNDKTKSRLELELADGGLSDDVELMRLLWNGKLRASVETDTSFYLGVFKLKSFRGNYRDRLTLSFVSYAKDYTELRKVRNEHYENVTLGDLARMLIRKAGFVPVVGMVPDVKYQKVELKNESIEDFLKREARRYNLKFFVKGEKVAFGEFETKERKITEWISLEYEVEELKGVSKVIVEYWNGDKLIKYEHDTGKAGEVVYHVERVENEAQARLVAERIAKKLNKRKGKVRISTYGQPIYAGEIVKLEKPAVLRGKWEIERAVHRISRSEGWRLELELSPLA